MPRNYTELLNIAYEIEGLLSLQAQRTDNPVVAVDDLLASKIAFLSQAFPASAPAETTAPTPVAPVAADATAATEAITPTEATEASATAATAIAPAAVSETVSEAENAEAIADSALAEEKMMATQPVPETPVVNDTIGTPLSLEEKLARERARDIFRAFTLNDKFRFRRELFRNSQEEFDEALEVIAQMSTIDEAGEYIYNDLCLDPGNEDVKAFMDLLAKHF